MSNEDSHARAGDLAYLLGPRNHSLSVILTPGERVQSMHGVIAHEALIGREWGSQVTTHLGKVFTLLQPALDDVLRDMERASQVVYPKDIGYILLNMGIGSGSQVIEAGTGSGALTVALAHSVGREGHIYSYERRPEAQDMARRNLVRVGLAERVTLHLHDIAEGFHESGVRALFLDLPNPEEYLAQARAALLPGGFLGSILPTTNQVNNLLAALKEHHFGFVEVSELMHRYYKPVPGRLRPADTMVAHTGFLIFARRVAEGQDGETHGG
ncbi:MAG: tRNA (adenine-N1)-methyltransferase [Anaerolineales bacterium]|nr:tRNA (adenine-N1)-methyltransferase [Anaerolineales bacterium]